MEIIPYRRKIQYYENDPMGIVHHSNYIRWFEEARVDWMEQIGFPYRMTSEAGIEIPVLEVACEYKIMLCYEDTVRIMMRFTRMDATRMNIAYEVYNEETGQLCATGETKHCFYSSLKKRPVSLPKALPALYEVFLREYNAAAAR